jgi:hypothetical protein
MLLEISDVPSAASWTLRAISCVAALLLAGRENGPNVRRGLLGRRGDGGRLLAGLLGARGHAVVEAFENLRQLRLDLFPDLAQYGADALVDLHEANA